jgi:hypothetical protein
MTGRRFLVLANILPQFSLPIVISIHRMLILLPADATLPVDRIL